MLPIGHSFTIIESVDSTNNYAMARVHAGLANHGDTYFTFLQTAGKGQRGKAWHATAGENILMSVIIVPGCEIFDQFLLCAMAALAGYDLLKKYATDSVSVKWPNDIYWRDRKAGGILIENVIKGDKWQYAIIGMGINVNQTLFDPAIHHPVSLKQITGKRYDVIALAKELCGLLQKRLDLFAGARKSLLLEAYNDVLFKRGELVTLKQGNILLKRIIEGVNRQGELITGDPSGQVFIWGKVEWIL